MTAKLEDNKSDKKQITPAEKPRYNLNVLLKECDEDAHMPEEIIDWDKAPSIGKEIV
ncbi:MAG: hypothetical protein ABW072_06805 [Sedimenticola sp.]